MAEEKRYISSVKLGEDAVYHVKDIEAREALDNLWDNVLLLDCGTSTVNVDDVVAEG